MQSTVVPSQSKGKPVANTCLISGLPVPIGAPIRALLLTTEPWFKPKNPEDLLVCQSAGISFPRTFPIHATCGEYGEICNATKLNNRAILQSWIDGFGLDAIEEKGRGFMSFNKLMETASCRIVVSHENGGKPKLLLGYTTSDNNQDPAIPRRLPSEVNLGMIREDIYQSMLRISFDELTIEKAHQEANHAWESYQKFLQENASGEYQKKHPFEDRPEETKVLKNQHIRSVGLGTQICLLGQANLPKEVKKEFLQTVGEFYFIRIVMIYLGKSWRAYNADQPQSPNMKLHTEVLRAFMDAIK